MKIGKFTLSSFKEYLQKYDYSSEYAQHYDMKQVVRQIEMQQTYVFEFLINDQPSVLALHSLTQSNNLVIRLWGLSKQCDPSLAVPLFKKYSDYI